MTAPTLQPLTVAAQSPAPTAGAAAPLIEIENLSLYYGPAQALKNITFSMREREVTAFIGPSGCGKSTLIRCLNRMNDLIDGVRITGTVKIGGHDIYAPDV
ncbi:MAG: ATP-binding cassette domain-containing protein, partial [Verrucomicrobiae bacterium]|nr:ATP-binding cassette domain-containing protein [Verrucomicrobiae bacterium]